MKRDCKLPNSVGMLEHTCAKHKDGEQEATSGTGTLYSGLVESESSSSTFRATLVPPCDVDLFLLYWIDGK